MTGRFLAREETDRFRIGLFHPSSWAMHFLSPLAKERNPDVLRAATHARVARAAEEAGLDYVFLADSWGSRGPRTQELGLGDPMVFAPVLAGLIVGVTNKIKVITTLHQAWVHPLEIARIGACLDQLSGGRWGMNAVSGAGMATDLLESVHEETAHDALYDLAAESMEIIRQAWSDSGQVDFHGRHFKVKGRLVGPRPLQAEPLVVSAGASPAGCEFAGRYASIAFMPGRSSAVLIDDRREQIRAAAERAGRRDTDVKLLLHASVVIGETQEEAERIGSELRDSVDLRATSEAITMMSKHAKTYEAVFSEYTEDELRDLGLTTGTVFFHGDGERVADMIQELQETSGCDGVSLSFPIWQPEQIERFARDVAPILTERGVWSSAASRGWPW